MKSQNKMKKEQNVLGQGKKSRYNPDLADQENRKADLEKRLNKNNPQDKIESAKKENTKSKIITSGDYLVLTDIKCQDSKGDVFEEYKVIKLARNLSNTVGFIHETTYLDAVKSLQKKSDGEFLPSAALTCNILMALFEEKDNPDVNAVLKKYKKYNAIHGWVHQNTVINRNQKMIIHYPKRDDIGNWILRYTYNDSYEYNKQLKTIYLPYQSDEVNIKNQAGETFRSEEIRDISITDAVLIPHYLEFLQNLTGLKDPKSLKNISDYLGLNDLFIASANHELDNICRVNLGGINDRFNINAETSFVNNYQLAYRAVKEL
jgi:hypothetical protein